MRIQIVMTATDEESRYCRKPSEFAKELFSNVALGQEDLRSLRVSDTSCM
jgi:hypothetical protein